MSARTFAGGLIRITSYNVCYTKLLRFNSTEVAKFKESQRTDLRKGNIGFVFQSFNLIDELNVYENVELPLVYLKLKGS